MFNNIFRFYHAKKQLNDATISPNIRSLNTRTLFWTMIATTKFFSALLIALLGIGNLFAQNKAKLFTEEILFEPILNSDWFDETLTLTEIVSYPNIDENKTIALANGYATYLIDNKNLYLESGIFNFYVPVAIDIVYTKYPFNRIDWITNYYILLAQRVKALLEMDSTLNTTKIDWQLIMQTKCMTESDAQKLFHGIVIHLRSTVPQRVESKKTHALSPSYRLKEKSLKPYQRSEKLLQSELSERELIAILYPVSINKKVKNQHIPVKTKVENDTPCPSFPNHRKATKKGWLPWLRRR